MVLCRLLICPFTNRLSVPPSSHLRTVSMPPQTLSFRPHSQRSTINKDMLSTARASIKVLSKKCNFEEGILEIQQYVFCYLLDSLYWHCHWINRENICLVERRNADICVVKCESFFLRSIEKGCGWERSVASKWKIGTASWSCRMFNFSSVRYQE